MGRSRTPQASSSVEPTTINAQSLKKRKIAGMLHFFKRAPADKATAKLQSALGALVTSVEHEICYNVELSAELDGEAERRLLWLLAETFEPAATARESFLGASDVLEVGPRLSFSTAWCSNALSICAACGLTQVARVEQSRRYKLTTASPLSAAQRAAALASLHDRMTEAVYEAPLAPTADTYHLILTAETHNFPTGVAPFAGAETGTGGRIRDVHATGRGALVVAGVSSYCVGALRIPGYELPWEEDMEYPPNLASPLQILVEGSNGASDYGNKFGEPVICGFARSFGLTLPSGERREWVKPIMFSAGLGQMSAAHADKGAPEPGMWVVKLGGPAYRIGVGGGAASSRVGDAASAALDFDAVQRGDAEMENKMNRVIRACVELGKDNPIVSIHDQGAGGNGNVLKEICEPLGATLQVRDILSADPTLSVLELWGAEYQENCALLLRDESEGLFASRSNDGGSTSRHDSMNVGVLLHHMETFSGIVVAITNRFVQIGTMGCASDAAASQRTAHACSSPPAPPSLYRHRLPPPLQVHSGVPDARRRDARQAVAPAHPEGGTARRRRRPRRARRRLRAERRLDQVGRLPRRRRGVAAARGGEAGDHDGGAPRRREGGGREGRRRQAAAGDVHVAR